MSPSSFFLRLQPSHHHIVTFLTNRDTYIRLRTELHKRSTLIPVFKFLKFSTQLITAKTSHNDSYRMSARINYRGQKNQENSSYHIYKVQSTRARCDVCLYQYWPRSVFGG